MATRSNPDGAAVPQLPHDANCSVSVVLLSSFNFIRLSMDRVGQAVLILQESTKPS
jgi:hypothetical protein